MTTRPPKTWTEADRQDRNITVERCAQVLDAMVDAIKIAYDQLDKQSSMRPIALIKYKALEDAAAAIRKLKNA